MLEAEPMRPADLELGWNADAQHAAQVLRAADQLRARMDSLVWDAAAADLSLQSGSSSALQAASSRKR
jgi:hypothetical protein